MADLTGVERDRPHPWLSLFAWLLPASAAKNWVLRKLGNEIGQHTSIGPNLVLGCGKFRIGDHTVIDPFNLFKGLSAVHLGAHVRIGRYNQISAAPAYQQHSDKVGMLIMRDITVLINRHYIDCSGQVILEHHSAIGGIRTIVQSHEFDLGASHQTVGKVVIGEFAMTASCCLLLKDSYVPPYSVLAAGSTLGRSRDNAEMERGLYGGVPAKFVRPLPTLAWYEDDDVIRTVPPFDDATFELDGS